MQFNVIPTPEVLKEYVECIRQTEYDGKEKLAINVCLNGLPGIAFQHNNGHSPLENISTSSGIATSIPTLYIYGQMTQPGVMNHNPEPFTTTQIVLKPHALQTLLGLNASAMTNSLVDLAEFASGDLNMRLLEAPDKEQQATLVVNFLLAKLQAANTRDQLVEESLHLIHTNSSTITVQKLLECLNISERQFEKRFSQVVGLTPHFYIRVKRFNEAIRLMQSRRFKRLTELAYTLNFYDQSHFVRDVKAFSGITPKNLFQKVDDFQVDQQVIAYT